MNLHEGDNRVKIFGQDKSSRTSHFIKNGLILTATSLFLRLLSVKFGAYVNSHIGAEGMGLYTLIMSVYGFAVTVATSGVGLASTRLCAEAKTLSERRGVLHRCLLYAAVCGSVSAVGLIFGADGIADLLGDERTCLSLRLLGFSMPFLSLSCVFGGYFTAIRKVSKNAAAQIFEQVIKFVSGIVGLRFFSQFGIMYACAAVIGSGMGAEIASFILAWLFYLTDKSRKDTNFSETTDSAVYSLSTPKQQTSALFHIAVPVAAAAYIRSAFTTIEHILIPNRLKYGRNPSPTALADYGIFCGMAFPIIMLPTAFLYSFTGILIPEAAEAKVHGNTARIRTMSQKALSLTLWFSVGCAVIFCLYAMPLGRLIYHNDTAGEYIRLIAPLIPVMYLDHAIDALLKGLGEQLYCMKVNILDAAMSVALVWLLCGRYGIHGYIVTIYLCEILNASLSYSRLCRYQVAIRWQWLVSPSVGSMAVVLLSRILTASENWGSMTFCMVGTVAMYVCGSTMGRNFLNRHTCL